MTYESPRWLRGRRFLVPHARPGRCGDQRCAFSNLKRIKPAKKRQTAPLEEPKVTVEGCRSRRWTGLAIGNNFSGSGYWFVGMMVRKRDRLQWRRHYSRIVLCQTGKDEGGQDEQLSGDPGGPWMERRPSHRFTPSGSSSLLRHDFRGLRSFNSHLIGYCQRGSGRLLMGDVYHVSVKGSDPPPVACTYLTSPRNSSMPSRTRVSAVGIPVSTSHPIWR